ncbi:hypothetical protein CCH79_00019963, partial [Gambusia affinis]
ESGLSGSPGLKGQKGDPGSVGPQGPPGDPPDRLLPNCPSEVDKLAVRGGPGRVIKKMGDNHSKVAEPTQLGPLVPGG